MSDHFVEQTWHPGQTLRGDLEFLVALPDEAVVLKFEAGKVEQDALSDLFDSGPGASPPVSGRTRQTLSC